METWMVYALLSAVFASLTAILAKFGLQEIDADLGNAIRTAFVFVFVTANYFLRQTSKDFSQLTSKIVGFLFLSACATALSWIFYYRAMKFGNVSYVAAIDKGSIVLTILLAFLILKEPLTPKLIIGGLMVAAGLVVITLK